MSTRVVSSRKQQALWMLEKLSGATANNLNLTVRVQGRLDVAALRASLTELVTRHVALRTCWRATGSQLQALVVDTVDVQDIEILDAGPDGSDLDAELSRFVGRRFALQGELPIRAAITHLTDEDVFCLAVHHLVFDTISATVVLDELACLYANRSAQPPEPQTYDEPEPSPASLAYWRNGLTAFDRQGTELSFGRPDVTEPTLVGASLLTRLSPEAHAVVAQLRRQLRAPEATILLAAYSLLLVGHGADEDLVVGTPVNVRPPERQRAVGYHVNVLPIRTRVAADVSVRELVRTTRNTFFDALAHADVPVDALNDLAPPATTSGWHSVLFRHVFNYVPAVETSLPPFGNHAATLHLVENGYSKFDLEFFVMPGDDGTTLRAAYRTEIFDEADVLTLVERYDALLCALPDLLDNPVGEVDVWSAHDREVTAAANDTATAPHDRTVLDALRTAVADRPDELSLIDGDRTLSYRAYWDATARFADELRHAGVRADNVVAVAMPRSAELAVAVAAIWRLGAVYLPVDPEHPRSRIAYQLDDSGVSVVVSRCVDLDPEPSHRTRLAPPALDVGPASESDEPAAGSEPDAAPRPDSPAYLMYTSGSTGRPKGTLVSHRALTNLVDHFVDELALGPASRVLWSTTFSFDISGLELWAPLAAGARLVVAPDDARTDGRVLAGLVEEHGVTVVQATPTTWRVVLDDAGPALRGRKVLCGGEPLPATLARRLIATGCTLHHVYGPTETTIWSTSAVLDPADVGAMHVGRPIRNTSVHVLDDLGRALPPGVAGELCIAGTGVAMGYHDRPELTAQRFGERPDIGRFYRTGDVARWRADGVLELMGRADRQVKLRGNRVELGEIENVLADHPDVRDAAVVLRHRADDEDELVAFVTAADGRAVTGDNLWGHASSRLPRAVVPASFHVLSALPTTLNDKTDYPALTRLADEQVGTTDTDDTAGATGADGDGPLEALLMHWWATLLERDDIGPDSNFFLNGGHSLMGAHLVQRVEAQVSVSVPLSDLFAEPTPRRLAARLSASGAHIVGGGE